MEAYVYKIQPHVFDSKGRIRLRRVIEITVMADDADDAYLLIKMMLTNAKNVMDVTDIKKAFIKVRV